jgi:hypothetical protein
MLQQAKLVSEPSLQRDQHRYFSAAGGKRTQGLPDNGTERT